MLVVFPILLFLRFMRKVVLYELTISHVLNLYR